MHFTLKQAREHRGIEQEYFAELLGVSVPTLINYEKGRSDMRVGTANKAAKLLGFSFNGIDFTPAEILGRKEVTR